MSWFIIIDCKAVSAEDMLLGLRVEGLRFDESDFEFEDGSGLERLVRVWVSTDKPEGERRVEGIELVSINTDAQDAVSDVTGVDEESKKPLAGPDWDRRRDMGAENWTAWTFKPGEWNDCGRKDEHWRQLLCKVKDMDIT